MLKYGFTNLRRLETVEPVEIRPITLLIGRNSSGKSTFLRTIPLFRQSINTKTSSPILWFGDLVDFGSYDISVTSGMVDREMSFTFVLDDVQVVTGGNIFYYRYSPPIVNSYENVRCKISIAPVERRTRISNIEIELSNEKTNIALSFDEDGVLTSFNVNDTASTLNLDIFRYTVSTGTLFPAIISHAKAVGVKRQSGVVFYPPTEDSPFEKEALRIIRASTDKRISEKTLKEFVRSLFLQPFLTNDYLRRLSNSQNSKFRTFIREMAADPESVTKKQLSDLILGSSVPNVVDSISSKLKKMFGSTLYIGPARARSERYYRYQDLSVSEIDPDGKNFPMFLNSLSYQQMNSLSNWIKDLFGYGITVIEEAGHISIKLVEHDSSPNVTDVGYGVSQILPVLGQIWWARARPRGQDDQSDFTLLAVEQPELHLHPAHQALLADALVGEALVSADDEHMRSRVSFIVETHSETLINRLGELIGRKRISRNEVQILLFEQSLQNEDITVVRSVEYDEKGVIVDWPYGFFEPESR
ncbi:hypothetical protein PMNALOAF_0461 [Methylobacterium adhaesivum]|uniref:AAA family ATPase n=1 Tax=Methylobacterium adhaesivum TaxID=333297 RepID=A0ABT8BFW6_9HYPH|nr:AAA family ATPase [Methylobacterium adhaesivum]MDN3590160.1 AAA family ATPase [Methylobacterium adhaesivum]GJD29229.1 hypothetical protein PMNALOAF_0461 [Methylobacterium adhaesivum]